MIAAYDVLRSIKNIDKNNIAIVEIVWRKICNNCCSFR